jgi:hypothetical protein
MSTTTLHITTAMQKDQPLKGASMMTLHSSHPSEAAARRAIESLRAGGVPADGFRLLVGSPLRDVRREPVGGFAAPVGPDDPVGTFAGRAPRRRHGAGSFAGDPDRQRQGSFADSDRVVIVGWRDDAERTRVTGLHGARRISQRAALARDAVEAAVAQLENGHAIVLVDGAEVTHAGTQLERPALAA